MGYLAINRHASLILKHTGLSARALGPCGQICFQLLSSIFQMCHPREQREKPLPRDVRLHQQRRKGQQEHLFPQQQTYASDYCDKSQSINLRC